MVSHVRCTPSHPRQVDDVDSVRDGLIVQFDSNEFVNNLTVPALANSLSGNQSGLVPWVNSDFDTVNRTSHVKPSENSINSI